MSKRLVVLLSNSAVDRKQQGDQHRTLVLLEANNIQPQIVYGDDPSREDRKKELLAAIFFDDVADTYPHFFLVSDPDNQDTDDEMPQETIQWIGQYPELQAMADENKLTMDALGLMSPAHDGPVPTTHENNSQSMEMDSYEEIVMGTDEYDFEEEEVLVEEDVEEGERGVTDENEEQFFNDEEFFDYEEGLEADDVEKGFQGQEDVLIRKENNIDEEEKGEAQLQQAGNAFVASRHDLFPEDQFDHDKKEQLFAAHSQDNVQASKSVFVNGSQTTTTAQDAVDRQSSEPENVALSKSSLSMSRNHPAGITSNSFVSTSSRSASVAAESSRRLRERKERSKEIAAQDTRFHQCVAAIVIAMASGGVAAVLVLRLREDED